MCWPRRPLESARAAGYPLPLTRIIEHANRCDQNKRRPKPPLCEMRTSSGRLAAPREAQPGQAHAQQRQRRRLGNHELYAVEELETN
jgi:hypothetical protein